MWGALIGFLTQGFQSWMQQRSEIKKAQHEKELRIIDSEDSHDALVSQGWKDEYLTILFTIPIVATFWGALFGHPEMIDNAARGIEAIGTLPEWYQVILGTIVLGSFSLRGYHAWKTYKGVKDKGVKDKE